MAETGKKPTDDDIILMAREAGLCSTSCGFDDWIDAGPSKPEIVAFARLVAAAEREACAKTAEKYQDPFCGQAVADEIRARGQA